MKNLGRHLHQDSVDQAIRGQVEQRPGIRAAYHPHAAAGNMLAWSGVKVGATVRR